MYYDSKYILERLNDGLEMSFQIKSEDDLLMDLEPIKNALGNVIADTHLPTEDLLAAFSDLRLKLAEHMKLDKQVHGSGRSNIAG